MSFADQMTRVQQAYQKAKGEHGEPTGQFCAECLRYWPKGTLHFDGGRKPESPCHRALLLPAAQVRRDVEVGAGWLLVGG